MKVVVFCVSKEHSLRQGCRVTFATMSRKDHSIKPEDTKPLNTADFPLLLKVRPQHFCGAFQKPILAFNALPMAQIRMWTLSNAIYF